MSLRDVTAFRGSVPGERGICSVPSPKTLGKKSKAAHHKLRYIMQHGFLYVSPEQIPSGYFKCHLVEGQSELPSDIKSSYKRNSDIASWSNADSIIRE